MKSLLLALLLLIAGTVRAQPVVQPNPERATLVLYRAFSTSNFTPDFHINYTIRVNGRKVCKLSDNRYLIYTVEPGPADITTKASGPFLSKRRRLHLDAKPNQVYYISCYQRNDLMKQWLDMTLTPYSAATARMLNLQPDYCMDRLEKTQHAAGLTTASR